MIQFALKDHVYVDQGASNEDEGYVYMLGNTYASIWNMDGDSYVVNTNRLTKVTPIEDVDKLIAQSE